MKRQPATRIPICSIRIQGNSLGTAGNSLGARKGEQTWQDFQCQ
jgi:hypothetical protein